MKYVKSCLIITMLAGIGYATCPYSIGDMNGDFNYNVLDIVMLVDCVLTATCTALVGDGCYADINGDGNFDVLDIVILANCVLAGNCGG